MFTNDLNDLYSYCSFISSYYDLDANKTKSKILKLTNGDTTRVEAVNNFLAVLTFERDYIDPDLYFELFDREGELMLSYHNDEKVMYHYQEDEDITVHKSKILHFLICYLKEENYREFREFLKDEFKVKYEQKPVTDLNKRLKQKNLLLYMPSDGNIVSIDEILGRLYNNGMRTYYLSTGDSYYAYRPSVLDRFYVEEESLLDVFDEIKYKQRESLEYIIVDINTKDEKCCNIALELLEQDLSHFKIKLIVVISKELNEEVIVSEELKDKVIFQEYGVFV